MTMNKKVVSVDQLAKVKKYTDTKIDVLRREIGTMFEKDMSLDSILDVVRRKEADRYFRVGDQLHLSFKFNNVDYDCPNNIVDIADAVFKDDEVTDERTVQKALWLEWEYTICESIPFDPQEALIEVKTVMPAGTYHFKVAGDSWAGQNGKYIQFTLLNDLPAGTHLRPANAYNTVMAGANMNIYNDCKDTTVRSTVVMSEGQEGTFLGTMWGTDFDSSIDYLNDDRGHILNHYHRVFLGYNNWPMSYVRQYLNNTGTGWWVQQTCFDRAPASVDSKEGFLSGLKDDFLALLKPTKVVTPRNTVTDGGGDDITYDKIFLASKKQMAWQTDGEGANVKEWAYYRQLADEVVGERNTFLNYQTYPELIRYGLNAKTSAQYVWKRSANRSYANHVWSVNTSGNCTSSYAYNSLRLLPACVIGG